MSNFAWYDLELDTVSRRCTKRLVQSTTLFEGEGYTNVLRSKYCTWSIEESKLPGIRVFVNDTVYDLSESTQQEARELIMRINDDYPGLPAEADVMFESVLKRYCQEHGEVNCTVSIAPMKPEAQGGRRSFIVERDTIVARNGAMRLIAVRAAQPVVLEEIRERSSVWRAIDVSQEKVENCDYGAPCECSLDFGIMAYLAGLALKRESPG